MNEHLQPGEPPIAPYAEPRVKLTAASDQKKLNYKTLAMKLSEASEILDDRIDEFAALIRERHGLDEDALGSAAAQSTTEVIAVGRIASDSPEGKLNPASLVLETSRRTGGGRRVPLNLQKLASANGKFPVFPGQIVAFRGINTSGTEFVAHEALDVPLLPSAASAPTAIEAHRQRLRGDGGGDPDAMDTDTDSEPAPLSVLFAAGPYTADDNLDFEPLHALCSVASLTGADALVLAGPFIDVDHPLIATGDFDLPEEALNSGSGVDPDTATLATLFKHLVSPALNRLAAAHPAVTMILVPSVRDAVARHVSWPQDAPPRQGLGLPRPATARLVGNPMTLSLNETLVGLSSHDALWDLRQEELLVPTATATANSNNSSAAADNLFSRLARHLLEQRHYAPVFPPTERARLPKTGAGDGVPVGASLDTSFLKLGEMVNVRPDVVVVPSALPPFARVSSACSCFLFMPIFRSPPLNITSLPPHPPSRVPRLTQPAKKFQVVESVVVINPGHLSKRRGAGTYARMTLHPPPPPPAAADGAAAGVVGHRVFERARVEIVRI